MDLMHNYPDKHFELAIVDPPYGLERFKKGKTIIARCGGGKDKKIKWDKKPSKQYFNELFRVSQKQIIWGANNFELPSSEYFIIWDKIKAVDNFAGAEMAWTNCKTPAKIFHYCGNGGFVNPEKRIHPCQKPVKLYRWLLENYAKEGDKILDTHLGSGSIAIACHYMGFDLTACEIDKDYYDAAMKRIKEETVQESLF